MAEDERTELLEDIAQHDQLSDFLVYFAIPWALLRRAGIDPLSWRGRILTGFCVFGWVALTPILVALATGTLTESPWLGWLAIALLLGTAATSMATAWGSPEIDTLLAAMDDLDGLRAWRVVQRRSNRYMTACSAAVAAVFMVVLFALPFGDWKTVPPGSIWLLFVVLYLVGEGVAATIDTLMKATVLAGRHFELQSHRLLDSPPLRSTIDETRGATLFHGFRSAALIVCALILLPRELALVLPTVAGILVSCYASIVVAVATWRHVVARIVREEKTRRLADLSGRIDDLLRRVPDLSGQEERKLDLLRKTYDDMRDSPEVTPVLPAALRMAGSALIPTLTFLALAAVGGYVEREMNSTLDYLGW